MGQILIRDLEDSVRDALRRRAARRGCSVAEEVRGILRAAAAAEEEDAGAHVPLGSRISARFATAGLDENLHEMRGQEARPADVFR
jgi:plasmid stability protein